MWAATGATTYELHNLQAVAVLQSSCGPAVPRNDFAIQFYGHTVRLHANLFQQGCDSQMIRELAFLAIDPQFHLSIFACDSKPKDNPGEESNKEEGLVLAVQPELASHHLPIVSGLYQQRRAFAAFGGHGDLKLG